MTLESFLVADLGNHFLKVGLIRRGRIEAHHRLGLDEPLDDEGIAVPTRPEAFVYASVNPARDPVLEAWAAARFGLRAEKLGRDRAIPLANRCRGVGADRLANALGALARFPGGAVIVDVGTAITVDAVSPDRAFLGGAILPGPHLGAWALAERAALLELVEPGPPARVLGAETAEAIRSGLHFGTVGAVERLATEIAAALDFRPALVMTGGGVAPYVAHLPGAVHCPTLSLEGIVVAALRD